MLGACLLAFSASAAGYRAPRTPWGTPDLQGVWTNASQTTLERRNGFKALVASTGEVAAFETRRRTASAARAAAVSPDAPGLAADDNVGGDSEWREWGDRLARIDGQPRTSWITDPADGRLPYTDAGNAALARVEAAEADYASAQARPAEERCLVGIGAPAGPPMLNASYNANYQILETPDATVILAEMDHDVRIIHMDPRRRHTGGSLRPWFGDSVGWWEGETLVVETVRIHPLQSGAFNFGGRVLLSDQAKVVERFTRTGRGEIRYRFTMTDPANYRQPWSAEMPLRAATGAMFEYACHEGNYALGNILAGARAAEREAATVRAGP